MRNNICEWFDQFPSPRLQWIEFLPFHSAFVGCSLLVFNFCLCNGVCVQLIDEFQHLLGNFVAFHSGKIFDDIVPTRINFSKKDWCKLKKNSLKIHHNRLPYISYALNDSDHEEYELIIQCKLWTMIVHTKQSLNSAFILGKFMVIWQIHMDIYIYVNIGWKIFAFKQLRNRMRSDEPKQYIRQAHTQCSEVRSIFWL